MENFLILAIAGTLILHGGCLGQEFPRVGESLSKSDCLSKFGDSVYYNEINGECTSKILDERVPFSFMAVGTVRCPAGSYYDTFSAENGKSMKGHCLCPPHLVPSPDLKSCIVGKLNNEPCNPGGNIHCKEIAGLKCSSNNTGTCKCSPSGVWNAGDSLCYSDYHCSKRRRGSYYDTVGGKCLIPLGPSGRCHSETRYDDYTGDEIMPLCPINSKCSSPEDDAVCKCNYGFGPDTASRKCIPVKMFEESCKDSQNGQDPCDTSNGLTCQNGICSCVGRQRWVGGTQGCAVTAGDRCSPSSRSGLKCVRNAKCVFQYGTRIDSNFKNDENYKCECERGIKSLGGFCYAGYLEKCELKEDCLHLSCIDGICNCPDRLLHKVSPDHRDCVALVGAPCTLYSLATANAKCTNGIITCQAGLIESSNGECLIPYQGECTSKGICNFEEGLACVEGKCECFSNSLRYKNGTGCVSRAGGPCGKFPFEGKCEGRQCEYQYSVKCENPSFCIAVSKSVSKCISRVPLS